MPAVLLPRTAAPFAERSAPTIVLDSVVNPWLTQTLKRVNKHKRPLNSVPQHLKCLTEILAGPNAIWNLCSLCVPRAPEAQIEQQTNPISDALFRYQFIHIQAYVVSIDMVHSHEIAFKLTKESIKSLVDYHKDVYMVDQVANTWHWTEKDSAVKKLNEEFVQAINKYVFRTDKIALEGIEDDGAGELLCGQSEEVRNAIMDCFLPLLPPPPPRVVEVAPPAPTLISSPAPAGWWASTPPSHQHMAPVEPWKILPSNNPATSAPYTTGMTASTMVATSLPQWGYEDDFSNSFSFGTALMDESPMVTSGAYAQSMTASSEWWSPQPSPSPQQEEAMSYIPVTTADFMTSVSMPAMYQPCSTAVGFGGFGWDNTNRYMDFATTM